MKRSLVALAFMASTLAMASVETDVAMMLANKMTPQEIITQEQAAGVSAKEIIAALIADGVDPSTFLAPAAAGKENFAKNDDHITFSKSYSGSFGGGGRSSVSPN